ncbi:MAG TPA: porphobilinogen synthase [Gammaproteobacteria bacterium]|jgi:porphobilinogen synthase
MRKLNVTTPGRVRPRRLRRSKALRNLVAETHIAPSQFIVPRFVLPADDAVEPFASLPGLKQLGFTTLLATVEAELSLGIRAALLFGHPEAGAAKTADGRLAWDPNGAVQQATMRLKRAFGDDLIVMTDVCLCAYTDHGHCGLIEQGRIANDVSLEPIVKTALSHAEAGADVIAPSDMMDGRIAAIRDALDAQGFSDVILMAYAVKYASGYYGPFRDAAGSAPQQGDRQSYQMDCRNAREALRETALDAAEGADILMVKPALAYLDVIARVRESTGLPLAAYNVSGEYAMVKAAAAQGWIDEAQVVRENLLAIRRAGADQIITYHAADAIRGRWL